VDTATIPIPDSKPRRKQLSDQLDRLDGIIDGLSEGLNGAVADAAREGTRLAVKDAIVEIMTDPALRARLHQATEPGPARRLGLWKRLKERAARAANAVRRAAAGAADAVRRGARAVLGAAADAGRAVRGPGRLRKLGLVALGAGAVAGVASFLAPHAAAAAISGTGGALAAAAVQATAWARRTFRALVMG
jgi:hypothetical protein